MSMYFEYLNDLFLDFRLLNYLTTDLFLSKGRNMQVMYVLRIRKHCNFLANFVPPDFCVAFLEEKFLFIRR